MGDGAKRTTEPSGRQAWRERPLDREPFDTRYNMYTIDDSMRHHEQFHDHFPPNHQARKALFQGPWRRPGQGERMKRTVVIEKAL